MFSLLAQTLRHVPCIHVQKMPQIVSVKAEVTSFDTGFFFLPAWKYLSSTGLVWAEHCMWRCGEACQAVRVHPVKAVRNAWLYRLQGLSEESQVTTPSPHVEHLQVTFGGAPHSKGAGGKRFPGKHRETKRLSTGAKLTSELSLANRGSRQSQVRQDRANQQNPCCGRTITHHCFLESRR